MVQDAADDTRVLDQRDQFETAPAPRARPCAKPAIMDEIRRGIAQRDSASSSGKQVVTSYDKEDLNVAVHGDVGISTYRCVFTAKSESIDVRRRHRTTNVWMKRQGRWQIVAAHTAFALDMKQAAMLSGEARWTRRHEERLESQTGGRHRGGFRRSPGVGA